MYLILSLYGNFMDCYFGFVRYWTCIYENGTSWKNCQGNFTCFCIVINFIFDVEHSKN